MESKRPRGRPRKNETVDPPKEIHIRNPLPDFLDTLNIVKKDGKAATYVDAIVYIVNEYKIRRSLLR